MVMVNQVAKGEPAGAGDRQPDPLPVMEPYADEPALGAVVKRSAGHDGLSEKRKL